MGISRFASVISRYGKDITSTELVEARVWTGDEARLYGFKWRNMCSNRTRQVCLRTNIQEHCMSEMKPLANDFLSINYTKPSFHLGSRKFLFIEFQCDLGKHLYDVEWYHVQRKRTVLSYMVERTRFSKGGLEFEHLAWIIGTPSKCHCNILFNEENRCQIDIKKQS